MKHDERRVSCLSLSCFAFLFALLQFCLFLNNRDVNNAHEGRVVATAREMLERRDWVVPHCNGVPRLAKPPLAYWATGAAWTIAGRMDVGLARLPAALCGAIAALLMIDLARRTLGRDAAICAGLVWISTWFIVDEYRKAMADPYLAFFTLLSVWAWVAADQARTRGRGGWLVALFYFSAAMGALAKGHLILLHLALALIPYQIVRRKWPRLSWAHAPGAALFLVVAAAWPAYVYFTVPNAWATWRKDLLASGADNLSMFDSLEHYFVALPLTSLPWTIFAVIGALMAILGKRRRVKRTRWPLVWLAAAAIAFSLVPMKKNAYLLPAMPAQTLLAAAALATAIGIPRSAKEARIERGLLTAHLAGAIVALAVGIYLLAGVERFEIEPPAPLMGAVATGFMLLLGIRWLSPVFRSMRTVIVTALLFGLAIAAVQMWVAPEDDNRRSDAPFARAVLAETPDGEPICLIGPGLREDVLFYLGRTLPRVNSIDELPADYRGTAIVTVDQYLPVRRSDRGDELATSAERRSLKDKLFLFRFPKAPPAPRHADR